MRDLIVSLHEQGICVVPLNYSGGKFIHPNYSDKFDTGFSLEELLALYDAGYDKGIAVIHGKCNYLLCALDFDEKNAPGEHLWQKYRHIVDPEVWGKILWESTRSAGYHGYFLCKVLPTQKSLASSPTGEEWIAVRSGGNNGITYCAPSPGYAMLNGSFEDLQELTVEEMQHICDAAAQLNQWEGHKSKKGNNLPSIAPPADLAPYFREFDRKVSADWVSEFLMDKGWTTDGNIKRKAWDGQVWEYIRLWRPGRSQREPASANLWLQSKRLSVFSTSTPMPAFGGDESFSHLPSQVLYHHSGRDWKVAYGHIREVAEEKRIDLPEAVPMAYSVPGRGGTEVWKVDVKGIIDWAVRSGYQWMRMSSAEESQSILVRIVDNVIYETDTAGIQRDYIREVDANYQEDGANRILYNFMPAIVKYMEALPVFDGELVRDDREHSYIFFRNGALRISKDRSDLVRYTDIDGCVFSRHIKDFDYEPASEHGSFGEFVDMISMDEQHKRFIMTALGYILHYYKQRDYAKALMIIEDVDDQEQARGRSGKGILAQFIEYLRYTVQQDGRNYKADSQFKNQRIVPGVQCYYLNDPAPSLLMNQFYNMITDDMLIEAKGKKSYVIPYRHSPKILITTNYLPNLESDSDRDRFIVLPIKKTFGASHSVRDAFPGETFFDDSWSRENRNGCIRFAVDCLQAFLTTGVQVHLSEEMKRNADQRVVKNLVADCIIEVLEKVMETAKLVGSEIKFLDALGEIDLMAEKPESIKKAFGWQYGQVRIYISRFYQYCLRGYQLKNYTDKRFFKAVNLYIDKMGMTKISDRRNNILGRHVTVEVKPEKTHLDGKSYTSEVEGEDLPF